MPSHQINFQKSYTERKAKHISSRYACSLLYSFDATKNKHDYGRGEDSIERLCRKIKNFAMKIITMREQKWYH